MGAWEQVGNGWAIGKEKKFGWGVHHSSVWSMGMCAAAKFDQRYCNLHPATGKPYSQPAAAEGSRHEAAVKQARVKQLNP